MTALAEPVGFAGTWGVALRHQQANPTAWTPELIEETASWTAVVKAIELDQQQAVALLKGEAPSGRSFVDRCAAEPELRRQLEHLCERELHGLLIAWLIEGRVSGAAGHRGARVQEALRAAAVGAGLADVSITDVADT